MRLIVIDVESFWNSKDYTLSKMGPIQYIRDARFSAQLLGWRVNREPVQVCEHDDIPAVLASLHLDAPDTITVAHNGNGFDFLIFSEIYGVVPSHTLDTIDMMRWCGLSSIINESHASLTAHFGTGVKRQGTVISDGKSWPDDFTPEEREAFKLYCMQDVEQCSENCFRMLPFITSDMLAFDTITSHMAMEPAIWADVDALRTYDAALTAQTKKAQEDLQHLFHFASVEEFQSNIRSAQKFCVMLRQLGVEPPVKVSEAKSKTKKAEMEAAGLDTSDPESWTVYAPALSKQDREFVELQEHPDERVALLVRTRLENNSSIQQSRTRTFIRMGIYQKPIPVMLKAFGAHTGRYAAGNTEGKSDSLNWQNISKRNPAMLPLRQAIKVPAGYKLVSCDSSQVEARVLAYVANQTDMLSLFANGGDVYADFGETISGIPSADIHTGAKSGNKKLKGIRNVSKTIILGCLGADTEVLTDNGWKPIVSVSKTDKLWDGEQWTEHGGVIFSGVKKVMDVKGVKITPNHRIFDGSSWLAAGELKAQPQFLSSALSFAANRFKMCCFNRTRTHMHGSTLFNVCPAVTFIPSMKQAFLIQLMAAVRTALTRVYKIDHGQNRESGMASSLLSGVNGGQQRAVLQNGQRSANVIAARSLTGLLYQILNLASQPGVPSAPSVKGTELFSRSIPITLTSVQMIQHEHGCLIGLTPVCSAVITLIANIIRTMVGEALNVGLKIRGISCRILSRLMDMINQSLNLTVSTMTAITNEGIYVSQPMLRTWGTKEVSTIIKKCSDSNKTEYESLKKSESNYLPVFDILNSGPNNRFMIKTEGGPLIVHNCGYGTGYAKAAHTMWMQGQKQGDDYENHAEIVKSYIQMYRQKNSAITGFWKTCQGVVESLAMGGAGVFGGPQYNTLKYCQDTMPGSTVPTPSIYLPNGYALRYPNLHAEVNDKGKVEYIYTLRRGKADVPHRIFSSALCENLCQALAFALLQWEACRMYEAGIKLVCNIHDSFSTVVPEAQAEETADTMIRIMRTLPPWLPGCPIDAEAEITDDFTGA